MSEPAGERVQWYRFSGADVVFLVLTILILQGARQQMLDDPGLGWHIRNIDAMIAERGWLTHDPFTYPHDGEPKEWKTNQWLGELPLWLGWKWAGEEGIAVVTALVLAFMLRCLYRVFLEDGLPWPLAVVWLCLAAAGTQVSWVARPNIFTMLFMLWTARICDLFHQGRCSKRFTLWLLPLFCAWANMHGGFLAGLITLGATFGIEATIGLFAIDVASWQAARRRAAHVILLLIGCGLATLVNPYGVSLYPWLFKLLGNSYFMDLNREWWSPNFHEAGSFRFELLILLYPAILGLSRRRPNLVELGLGVLWLHFALIGFRYVPLWVLVATPTMAHLSMALPWLQQVVARLELDETAVARYGPKPGPAGWGTSAIVAILVAALAPLLEGRFARHNPKFIPAAALQKVLELHREHPEAKVFHASDWGGYLTWYGWPSFKNWIDDRNEVQGEAHIKEWNSIVTAEPGWQQKLDGTKVDVLAIHDSNDPVVGKSPLARLLGDPAGRPTITCTDRNGRSMTFPAWEEVFRDDHAVVYTRSKRCTP